VLQELKRAGILDISTPLYERFDFEPDLCAIGAGLNENLHNIIHDSVSYMQAMSNNDLCLGKDNNIQLFIFMTRQGIHIEIPAQDVVKLRSGHVNSRKFIDSFFERNLKKMGIVKRFYECA